MKNFPKHKLVRFAAFSKAAQFDPHDTTARLNMGAVLFRAGAYAKADELGAGETYDSKA